MNTENLTPDQFTLLLRRFNTLIKDMPPIDEVKKSLLSIKEDAINNHELNGRQREAITARVDNYLNNDYGDQRKKNKDQIADLSQIQETRKNKVNSNPK